MRSVYVATRLENFAQARRVAAAFVRAGWRWTYDWTVHGSVQGLEHESIAQFAALEVGGVLVADIVVVLMPGARGTHVELGIALGAGKPVLLVADSRAQLEDPVGRPCSFYHHPLVHQVFADRPEGMVESAGEWLTRSRFTRLAKATELAAARVEGGDDAP